MPKRPVIFALGRLISRQFSPTPTGIDRVDLRYARWLLDEQARGRQIIFVRQMQNAMYRVSDRFAARLIDELWRKWVECKNVEFPVIGRRLQIFGYRVRTLVLARKSAFLDPAITRRLDNNSHPVYLNAAHIGAQFTDLQSRLRERTGAELHFYLHDLIPIDFPEYYSHPSSGRNHQLRIEAMARQGRSVLVNSSYTEQRFSDYCLRHRLPLPQTHVLHIGVEDHIIQAAKAAPRPLPANLAERLRDTPYFIAIGTIEPRKNLLLLLHIWRAMARDRTEQAQHRMPCLVIVGRRGWENENILDMLDRSPSVRRHVIELNDLPDDTMIALVQGARALLMPSFEEGWGIPLSEALALGTKAVCADIPALRECGQNQATYLDPLDGIGWRKQIEHLANQARESHVGYQAVTWSNHFKLLADLLGLEKE